MGFVVYGAGAVGGVVGALLHGAGLHVQLVARGAHLDAIRRDGLRLVTPDTETTVRVPAADTVADLSIDDEAFVVVAVKSHQTGEVLQDLSAHAPETITVISAQNGVANERAMLRHFRHVLGVCVMLPATHLEPGVVASNSSPVPGMLDIGCFPGGTDDRAEQAAAAFRAAGFDSVVRPDIMAWKHRKLVANLGNAVQACFAPGEARDKLTALVREEGERVLAGARVPVVSAEQDRARRGSILSPHAIGGRGGGSTWQSIRRGTGSVETDYLNGEITLLGRLHGVPTPANDLVRQITLRLAREHGQPSSLDATDLLGELNGQ